MSQKLPAWAVEEKEVERRKAKRMAMLLPLGAILPLVIALMLKVSFDGAHLWNDTKILLGFADAREDDKPDFFPAVRAKYNAADDAVRRNPENAEAYYNRGKVARAVLGSEDAIADFDTAIRLKSDYAEAYFERANAKRWSGWKAWDFNKTLDEKPEGQYAAALKDYDTAIQIRSDYVEAYEMRASLKEFLGQHFDAIQDYDIIIRLRPDYAKAYVWRGNVKTKLGQHFDAIQDYDAVIRSKPNYALAYQNRGFSKSALGQDVAALKDWYKAMELAEKAGDAELQTKIQKVIRDYQRD